MSHHIAEHYTPRQILGYVVENSYEADFLTQIALHKGGYSIAELADKEFVLRDGKLLLLAPSLSIQTPVEDPSVELAIAQARYITAFFSRKDERFEVHFLVHGCLEQEKKDYEELICREVVQYMIYKTILALRLDSPDKVNAYLFGDSVKTEV